MGEVGGAARGDLVVGEEGEEMGDVTVAGLVFGVVFGPLLQVAGFADLEGGELDEGGAGLGVEVGVGGQRGESEDFCGVEDAGEDGAGDARCPWWGPCRGCAGVPSGSLYLFSGDRRGR